MVMKETSSRGMQGKMWGQKFEDRERIKETRQAKCKGMQSLRRQKAKC